MQFLLFCTDCVQMQWHLNIQEKKDYLQIVLQ